ncbi:hypothetical protein GCM10027199_84540 [Amycolatopsis magusensis]
MIHFVGSMVTGSLLPPAQHRQLWTTVSTEGSYWMPYARYGLGMFEFDKQATGGRTLRGVGGSLWGTWFLAVGTPDEMCRRGMPVAGVPPGPAVHPTFSALQLPGDVAVLCFVQLVFEGNDAARRVDGGALVDQFPHPRGDAQLVPGIAAMPAGGALGLDQAGAIQAAQEILAGTEQVRGPAHGVRRVVLVIEPADPDRAGLSWDHSTSTSRRTPGAVTAPGVPGVESSPLSTGQTAGELHPRSPAVRLVVRGSLIRNREPPANPMGLRYPRGPEVQPRRAIQ